MVKVVPDRYGGHASHGRILDRAVRRSRAAWHPGGAGECAAHQKRAGTKNRCAGMPMADEIAYLRTTGRLLPPIVRRASPRGKSHARTQGDCDFAAAALRSGVRYAVTYQTISDYNMDDSIRLTTQ